MPAPFSFLRTESDYWNARVDKDLEKQVRALREMSSFLLDPDMEEWDQRLELHTYVHFRSKVDPWVKDRTPDMEEVLRGHLDEENDARWETYLSLQTTLSAEDELQYWTATGAARKLHLLVSWLEVNDETEAGKRSSWRWQVFHQTPTFLPGVWRMLLVTDKGSAGQQAFECSLDGEGMFGKAAKGFLPMRVIHEEERDLFFHLGDEVKFGARLEAVVEAAKRHRLDRIVLMVGHRDVQVFLSEGNSEFSLMSVLFARLRSVVRNSGVQVVFGGIPVIGTPETRKVIIRLNDLLFFQGAGTEEGRGPVFGLLFTFVLGE